MPYTVGEDVTEVTRVYRKADTEQIPNQDALNLNADIDRLVITNANQKQAVAELLAQYDDLSAAGKQTIGEARHQKLLDAQTLIGQLEQTDSKVRVIVPDKSGNGFDLDMTNHATATMFNDPAAGAVMHGNTALNALGQKEKLDTIINGNRPFTYEMVLRSNVTGAVDAAYHPDIIFSKGDSCATIRYGGTTIGFYICNSAGNWSDTLFNTSFNTSQYGNQFTTVTGTYSPENGGTLAVYFNGEPICTLPNVGSVKPSDFDLWIGKDPENPGRTGSGDYTGGICCKSCHAVITQGQVIPKLTPTPTPVILVTPSEPAQNPFNPDAGSNASKFPFTDVPSDSWYYSSVKAAWENDLIDGVTANEFKPNATLTVAQTIKLAAALHQLDRTGEVSLKNGGANWYDSYVNYAVTNGIIEKDYANYTKAQMNAPVTRGEFVHIFHGAESAYAAINTVADNSIPDVKMTDNFAAEIYEFYRAGILTGSDAKGTFHSASSIKRSEVSAILVRMFDTASRQSITLK